MKFKPGEKQKIIDYLTPLINKKIYGKDIDRIKKDCFFLMGFEIYDWALDMFTFELFNGFLNDEFSRGKYKFQPRFRWRKEHSPTLPNGSPNPHYNEEYWILF